MPKRLPKMYGRQEEMGQLRELIALGERLIVVTGCPGIGKSMLTLNLLDHLPNNQQIVPVLVDARCCRSAARVLVRLVKQLGVRFQQKNISMLCSWLAACSERVLLVLDNLDLPAEEDDALSALFNALLKVDKVHLLCSSRRRFYRGDMEISYLRMDDLGEASIDLLRDMVADLPDDSLMEVAMACDRMPFALCLVGQALRLAEDVGSLYSTVVSILDGNNEAMTWEPVLEGYSGESPERLPRLLAITKAVLDHLSSPAQDMLHKLGVFESLFDLTAAKAILNDELLEEALDTVVVDVRCSCLLDQTHDRQHHCLPDLVRLALPPTETDTDRLPAIVRTYYIDTLTTACNKYHSKDSFQALSGLWRDYNNLIDGLLSISRSPHVDKKGIQTLSSPRMMIFLHDAIAAPDYEIFYHNLVTASRELQSSYLESCTYCALAYHYFMEDNLDDALTFAQQSQSIVPQCENAEQEVAKAFNSLIHGKTRWMLSEDKEQGLSMARQALESFKVLLGIQNPLTIYVYEDYALMEKEIEHYQKARYYYNLIDFVAEDILGLHPGMLRGYDSRREIWERQGLFSRAAGVAQKAAEISAQFYGEHPLTAMMHSRWCECLIKSGDASDAIRTAALALNIREKLLGVHLDTALSNKMFAYLMLRKGHYALALKHGQRAFDMCQELQVHKKFVTDIEIMLGQAKRRQQNIETSYVKLETHRHSRSLENVLSTHDNINTITTEV